MDRARSSRRTSEDGSATGEDESGEESTEGSGGPGADEGHSADDGGDAWLEQCAEARIEPPQSRPDAETCLAKLCDAASGFLPAPVQRPDSSEQLLRPPPNKQEQNNNIKYNKYITNTI